MASGGSTTPLEFGWKLFNAGIEEAPTATVICATIIILAVIAVAFFTVKLGHELVMEMWPTFRQVLLHPIAFIIGEARSKNPVAKSNFSMLVVLLFATVVTLTIFIIASTLGHAPGGELANDLAALVQYLLVASIASLILVGLISPILAYRVPRVKVPRIRGSISDSSRPE